jgi:hypothetical protein
MAYLIGLILAVLVAAAARASRFDRDGAFYPTVLIVVASYCVLFAAMSGSPRSVAAETAVMGVFLVLAAAGFRKSIWFAVAGLAAHGVLDAFHGALVVNHGVPLWWPAFCAGYDITAAFVLAYVALPRGRGVPASGLEL